MSMTLHVNVVSAEQSIYSGTATMVFAPAVEGEVGITPRHAPLLTGLGPGEVRVQTEGGKEEHFFISGGMLEVQPHVVTILADTAQRASDLDEAAALQAKEQAERLMADGSAKMEYARARAQLAEAAAQLRALDRIRKKRTNH